MGVWKGQRVFVEEGTQAQHLERFGVSKQNEQRGGQTGQTGSCGFIVRLWRHGKLVRASWSRLAESLGLRSGLC